MPAMTEALACREKVSQRRDFRAKTDVTDERPFLQIGELYLIKRRYAHYATAKYR
jgi:hypothetical protein